MPIGEKIRELRRERGITQEGLAELLEVSAQSVSRWEQGVCYPDVELLPAIANYFDVTLDELAGMSRIRSEKTRNEQFTAALELERRGNWDAAIDTLRRALNTFPGDDGFRAELALALSRTGRAADRMEAIELSEAVLEHSVSEKLRSTVRANLCFLYKAAGFREKAMAAGKTLPHIWECREMLLPDLVPEECCREAVMRSFGIACQVLKDVASGREISFSLGYAPDPAAGGEELVRFLTGAWEEGGEG